MVPPDIVSPLQQLRALDGSSPQLADQLAILLDDEEFTNHILTLPEGDARWLVDCLDTVRISRAVDLVF
jgi:hypothetical protein